MGWRLLSGVKTSHASASIVDLDPGKWESRMARWSTRSAPNSGTSYLLQTFWSHHYDSDQKLSLNQLQFLGLVFVAHFEKVQGYMYLHHFSFNVLETYM